MKNKLVLGNVLIILLLVVLGCSFYNPLQSDSTNTASNNTNARATKESNKTLAEKAIDSTVGEEKIGIAECDELLDSISEQSKNQDDYVTKAGREFFLNRIRESIKKSFEENKNDPKEMAKNCKDLKKQLDKFRAEETEKNTEK
jgi:hypothetical protein